MFKFWNVIRVQLGVVVVEGHNTVDRVGRGEQSQEPAIMSAPYRCDELMNKSNVRSHF